MLLGNVGHRELLEYFVTIDNLKNLQCEIKLFITMVKNNVVIC